MKCGECDTEVQLEDSDKPHIDQERSPNGKTWVKVICPVCWHPIRYDGTVFFKNSPTSYATKTKSSNATHPNLLSFISKVEKNHFRSVGGIGANECAMILWNLVRQEVGLSALRLSDFPSWDGNKYVMPPNSRLQDGGDSQEKI